MHSITRHAKVRMSQRATPFEIVELLMFFGSEERSYDAYKIRFDKAAIARLTDAFGGRHHLKTIERWFNTYLIVSESDDLITVVRENRRPS